MVPMMILQAVARAEDRNASDRAASVMAARSWAHRGCHDVHSQLVPAGWHLVGLSGAVGKIMAESRVSFNYLSRLAPAAAPI